MYRIYYLVVIGCDFLIEILIALHQMECKIQASGDSVSCHFTCHLISKEETFREETSKCG